MDKIDILLLEIFYYSFTCFDPDLVYKTQSKNTNFMQLVNKAKLNRGSAPVRHSRFLPNFVEKSDVGIQRITHNLNSKEEPVLNQRKIPRRTADLKKVQKI